ncbi:hypothetical protein BXY66_2539 [Shimia isoporae]|uniref:Uncharacterized protein n=1 Tax=Shimia isoporae TaxID=647720 RepID=A0A4R1N3E0_9RHOB|nr:hypothetical protein [Shimia isoporae]TCL01227.1 hypothetical protein BXY66_2539 [Shimia isoporae]
MSQLILTKTRLFEGTWEGVLSYEGGTGPEPSVEVTFLEKAVPGVSIKAANDEGKWALHIPIPPESLSDGTHTILIENASNGERLDKITFIAGEALADDLRAEIDLLRAELDMLKRAFRRHCVETM